MKKIEDYTLYLTNKKLIEKDNPLGILGGGTSVTKKEGIKLIKKLKEMDFTAVILKNP